MRPKGIFGRRLQEAGVIEAVEAVEAVVGMGHRRRRRHHHHHRLSHRRHHRRYQS